MSGKRSWVLPADNRRLIWCNAGIPVCSTLFKHDKKKIDVLSPLKYFSSFSNKGLFAFFQ